MQNDASYLHSQAELCLQRGHERPLSALWLLSAPLKPNVSLEPPSRISFSKNGVLSWSRYSFRANYRGISVNDDVGEEFSTLQDAEAHATIVANELVRNCTQEVTVSVLGEDGILLAKAAAPSR